MAALVVGVVLFMVGGAATLLGTIVWRLRSSPRAYAVRVEEDAEERREQLRRAFKDQKPLADDEIAQQVQPVFAALAAAIDARDADRITAQFDLDRMVDECAAAGAGALPLRTARDRRAFSLGLRQGLGNNLVRRAAVFQWNATEIRNVKKLNNNEAAIIARHKDPEGGCLKMRWWLTRRDGAWKIYDMEDLEAGMRESSTIASLLGQGFGPAKELSRASLAIGDVIQALAQDDVDGAERKLAQVGRKHLPPGIEAMRQLAAGMVHMHRGRNAEALEALEAAHRFQPDLPFADFLRGIVLNRLGKPDQALKHLEAYRDLLGDDANICREIGWTLREQRRFPEAAKEYRKALDCNAKDAEAFLGLLQSLGGDDNKEDVGRRFAQLDSLRENFEVCAADCESREFSELLDPLVQVMHRRDPDCPSVDYYQALVQARTGKPDEAARSLKSALRKQADPEQRQEYDRHFVQVMASAGHGEIAYAASTDARQAFRLLAEEMAKRYRIEELKKLIQAHAAKHADDPLLGLYQADIHAREGRYEKADKAFSQAVARHPDAETLKAFRANRVLARYRTGLAMSAYRDIGPREETFAQLASLFFQDGEDAPLQTLLDEHAKDFPNSIELARYRWRLLIRRDKTAEGVALFKATLAKPLAKEQRSPMVSNFLWDMVAADKLLEGYRAAPDAEEAFRQLADGLLEEDRWDDLRRLLDAHRPAHGGDPWWAYYQGEMYHHDKAWDKAVRVLGAAMKGDPKEARDGIERIYVLALYKLDRWQQAYAEIQPHDKTFAQLANLMANDKKGVELEALLRAHRPRAASDPSLTYYEARSKVMQEKWAEAVSLFQQAYQKQTQKQQRSWYQSSFLHDMAEAGRRLEGYRAAMDKDAALNTLAGLLVETKKDKELADLLEEHHQQGGGEPWYSFYLGELHLLRGDLKKAAPYFAAALKKGDSTDQWRLRNGLFRARLRAGEAAVAYEEAKAQEGTFVSLASLCSQHKDAKQLQALLDAHRKVKPQDPLLISWELELRWLKQDHEGALRLLAEHKEDVFGQPRFRWKADSYRVRCLVKRKRGDEAVSAAEDIVKKHSGDRLLLVLAHAATGDVPQTLAAMGKLGKSADFVRRCYQDDDLGPILRSKEFAAFREAFAEPRP